MDYYFTATLNRILQLNATYMGGRANRIACAGVAGIAILAASHDFAAGPKNGNGLKEKSALVREVNPDFFKAREAMLDSVRKNLDTSVLRNLDSGLVRRVKSCFNEKQYGFAKRECENAVFLHPDTASLKKIISQLYIDEAKRIVSEGGRKAVVAQLLGEAESYDAGRKKEIDSIFAEMARKN